MKIISKIHYKPRFFGYYIIQSLFQIIDGLLTLIVMWFGYESAIMDIFCLWNLKKDIKRIKQMRQSDSTNS